MREREEGGRDQGERDRQTGREGGRDRERKSRGEVRDTPRTPSSERDWERCLSIWLSPHGGWTHFLLVWNTCTDIQLHLWTRYPMSVQLSAVQLHVNSDSAFPQGTCVYYEDTNPIRICPAVKSIRYPMSKPSNSCLQWDLSNYSIEHLWLQGGR